MKNELRRDFEHPDCESANRFLIKALWKMAHTGKR